MGFCACLCNQPSEQEEPRRENVFSYTATATFAAMHSGRAHERLKFPNETTAKCQIARTTTVKLTLYCHCRMPWRSVDKKLPGMKMAECEICCKWFHQNCEGIPDTVFRDAASWTCKACTSRHVTTGTGSFFPD